MSARAVRRSAPRCSCSPRRSRHASGARSSSRLPDADEAADHDVAPAHGRGRDVRRRPGALLGLLAVTMLGLGLACGGASALNHVLDRDIDMLMGSRTKERPVASGRVTPSRRSSSASPLGALFRAPRLRGERADGGPRARGQLFYVVVYTRWLKRSTPQNIVIGGAAGAVPRSSATRQPRAAWRYRRSGSSSSSSLDSPHFWALALMIKNAYAAAGVPMLPVVRGAGDRAPDRALCDRDGRLHDRRRYPGSALYTVAAVALAPHSSRSRSSCGDSHARERSSCSTTLAYLALLFTAAARPGAPVNDNDLRTAEPPLRLGALRALLAALRRHRDRRGPVSPIGLVGAQGDRLSAGGLPCAPEAEPPGRPLAVKDLFDTAGLTTTYGSALFADHVPAQTAPAVALESAGWGVVGKTNLHEFAFGTTRRTRTSAPYRTRSLPDESLEGRAEETQRPWRSAQPTSPSGPIQGVDTHPGRLLRRRRVQAHV